MTDAPTGPHARNGSDEYKEKLRRVIAERGLAGLANHTKWNELIEAMRALPDWRPSYRYKNVEGYISRWDVEWFYHLPFPFMCVEWMDIGLMTQRHQGRLVPPEIIDQSELIVPHLDAIGFDYEVAQDTARIWGYAPESREGFPPQD